MRFYSHGKLLITAEYAVLDGAQALCLPTKKGQFLNVEENSSGLIKWISKDENGEIWFQDEFKKDSFGIRSTSEEKISGKNAEISQRCIQILTAAEELSGLNLFEKGYTKTFGGSGYDIACAKADGPITYERTRDTQISLKSPFDPEFSDHIYFIYLNQKQNSREGIAHYRNQDDTHREVLIEKVSNINAKVWLNLNYS